MVVRTERYCDLCRQQGDAESATLTTRGRARRIDVCSDCLADLDEVAGAPRKRVTAAERVALGLAGQTPPS